MSEVAKAITAVCPECDTNIRFTEPPHLGQLVTCPECEETLEVIRRSPLKLDWAFEMEFSENDEEYMDDDYLDEFEDDDDDYFEDEEDDDF